MFVERLTFEPRSLYRAHLLGGEEHWQEHIGWGVSEYLTAALVDVGDQLISVTDAHRVGKGKPRKITPIDRPVRKGSRVEAPSIADFPIGAAMALTGR